MDDSKLERLVNQCRSNDVDAKVDAVAKLQLEFEAGVEITDPDGLLTVLKACLRTPNQHLTTATLSAFPPLLPLLITNRQPVPASSSSTVSPTASTSSAAITPSLIDAHTLRQVLLAFLPSGGVIDRLGDSRDRARDKARETLVILAGYAFRCGGSGGSKSREGKGPETPLMIFERCLREGGFASKVWRVREQSMQTLVQIRRAQHLFPIRPYLPALVEALEDTDGNVRECARQSVVELFTGPGVTDGARADLKKEMAKKGVRKTIVDGVLSRVLAAGPAAASDAGSENGDVGASTGNVPPSVALMNKKSTPGGNGMAKSSSHSSVKELSRPASRAAVASPVDSTSGAGGGSDVKPVYIASSRDLENELASMLKHFEGKETEHNWAPREKAILRVRGMLKGEVHERFTETFLTGLKPFMDASLKTLASLRTTVAANTCCLYSELAITLGATIDPFCDLLYTNLLRMASLTKKITQLQSQTTITTIIANTSAQPRLIIPMLWNAVQDKAIQTRQYAINHVKTFLEVHSTRSRHAIEAAGGHETLEKCVKKALADHNAGVRDSARQCFWVFDGVWRDRARAMMETLDSTARKQLEKACPNPDAMEIIPPPPTTPKAKKSSVAAAIAASRAKAKAIATAPPTLRHQATSAARTTSSPPSKRSTSPSLSTSSSTGPRATSPIARVASSGSPPRSRVVSAGTMNRSVSSGFVPVRQNNPPTTPPSPTSHDASRRRTSSPLVPLPVPPMVAQPNNISNSTFRRAIQTALPISPPPKTVVVPPTPTPRPLSLHPGIASHRESLTIAALQGYNEESLLLATNIPIPEDSDSEMDLEIDQSMNLISFSTPYEVYPPVPAPGSAASFSPRSSGSRPTVASVVSPGANSPPAGIPQPIVEDAMRARAEQAESAAERLLELVEPEEDISHSSIPPSLLLSSVQATPKVKPRAVSGPNHSKVTLALPKTPVNRNAAIMRRAALFQDSPAHNGSSTSLFDRLDGRDHQESAWWRKRMSLMKNLEGSLGSAEPADRKEELNGYISDLREGSADVRVLKKLALLCKENPVNEPVSPIATAFADPSSSSLPSLNSDLWTQDKSFDRLFDALVQFLDPGKSASELEYALIILWEILENQAPFLEGREADIFAALLQIRYCAQTTVMQATTAFRDALTSRIEPVYGLTTMHASIRAFRDSPLRASSSSEVKDGTYAFGLIALGKFILRLPAEILEDELPRLRATLTSALTDASSESSLLVREAAASSIIAAQLVLRDETHLFALLDGLPDDKKNLLTYLFDKHGSRGASDPVGSSGIEKLEKEMRRLDGRTSTPPRPSLSAGAIPP